MARRLVVLALAVLVACGSGNGSGGIGIASGVNVIRHPPGSRRAAPVLSKELARASWDWVRREDLPAGQDPTPPGRATAAGLDEILRGKVALVNFWGSWCGPCRKEQAGLEALWREYRAAHPGAVQFLGVNTRRDQYTAAARYLEEFDVTYPSVHNADSRIAYAFLVRVMPATYVLDRDGKVAAQIIGAVQDEVALRKILDEALA